MAEINRQIVLRSRPRGMARESDFESREGPPPRPAAGEVLGRNLDLASLDPATG